MANKIQWDPIEEMDLEDGTHTGYAAKARDGRYIWLSQISDDTWDVEMCCREDKTQFYTIANCKTLTSAKRYAARYLL